MRVLYIDCDSLRPDHLGCYGFDLFAIDRFAVTNAQFLKFVRETGYTTDAERYGWFVFHDFVNDADRDRVRDNVPAAPWWVAVGRSTGYIRTARVPACSTTESC